MTGVQTCALPIFHNENGESGPLAVTRLRRPQRWRKGRGWRSRWSFVPRRGEGARAGHSECNLPSPRSFFLLSGASGGKETGAPRLYDRTCTTVRGNVVGGQDLGRVLKAENPAAAIAQSGWMQLVNIFDFTHTRRTHPHIRQPLASHGSAKTRAWLQSWGAYPAHFGLTMW